jgi:hypothetical protein
VILQALFDSLWMSLLAMLFWSFVATAFLLALVSAALQQLGVVVPALLEVHGLS